MSIWHSWFIDERLKEGKSTNLKELKDKLLEWAKRHNFSLERKTAAMKARDKKVVSKTFHGAGIVVPVDRTGVGYRPLPETPGTKFALQGLYEGLKINENFKFHQSQFRSWKL